VARASIVQRATTNDIGEFRLFGLQPGRYVVSALWAPEPGTELALQRLGYAPTYYPGTVESDSAQVFEVGAGDVQYCGPLSLVCAVPH